MCSSAIRIDEFILQKFHCIAKYEDCRRRINFFAADKNELTDMQNQLARYG
jgi:hypothetical protein